MLYRFDVGPRASPGEVARVVNDMAIVSGTALRWSRSRTADEARDEIARIAESEPAQLSERVVSSNDRELLSLYAEMRGLWSDLEGGPPEFWYREWQHLVRRRYRKYGSVGPAAPWLGMTGLEHFAPALFSELVAQEMLRRIPEVPTVESIRYENPVEWILVGAGLLLGSGGIAKLLEIARDWSASRRAATANADIAEARVRRESAEASRAEQEAELFNIAKGHLLRGRADEGLKLLELLEGDHEAQSALWRLGATSPESVELPEG